MEGGPGAIMKRKRRYLQMIQEMKDLDSELHDKILSE
jgi:hypothetical protein